MPGFPQPLQITEIAQGTMHLFGNLAERQILLRDVNTWCLQCVDDVAITLGLDPQAMQLLTPQSCELPPFLRNRCSPIAQSRFAEDLDPL